ncbi:IclR family transcriptional regulator [Bordetella sputigena]|uniref:IclR family transcriptional regulator n=1 Tax=Bordetella sputigena TaxID=1416810 RepID=UPI0039EFE490
MSVLENATRVLRVLAQHGGEVSMTEIVAHLGLPKSSSSRLLKQMLESGLLERDPATLKYRPALLLLEVAHQARGSTPLIRRLEQALESLVADTGHTGYISVLDENRRDVVVLRAFHGSHPLRVVTQPGYRLPAYASSTGRALLARLDGDAARQAHPAATHPHAHVLPHAPRDAVALAAQLDEVRARGWAWALDESLAGVGSVSATVADPQSGETLAFCLSFPASLNRPGFIDALAHRLVGYVAAIGRAAGDAFWQTRAPDGAVQG